MIDRLVDWVNLSAFVHSFFLRADSLKIYFVFLPSEPTETWSATTKVVLQLMQESFTLIMGILNFEGFPKGDAPLIAERSMWRLKSRLLCGLPSKRNSIKRQLPHFDLKVLIRRQGQQQGHQWQVLCQGLPANDRNAYSKAFLIEIIWCYLLSLESKILRFSALLRRKTWNWCQNWLIDIYIYLYMCVYYVYICIDVYLACLQLSYANSMT